MSFVTEMVWILLLTKYMYVNCDSAERGRDGGCCLSPEQPGCSSRERTPRRHRAQCRPASGCGLLGSKGCKGTVVTKAWSWSGQGEEARGEGKAPWRSKLAPYFGLILAFPLCFGFCVQFAQIIKHFLCVLCAQWDGLVAGRGNSLQLLFTQRGVPSWQMPKMSRAYNGARTL